MLAFCSAWHASRGNYFLFADQHRAADELSLMTRLLDELREQNQPLPTTLKELALVGPRDLRTDADGTPLDPWGHPYVNYPGSDGFEVVSYGRDGAPGGVGLDADLSGQSRGSRPGEATLRQFTLEMNTGTIKPVCFVAGICTAVAAWVLVGKSHGRPFLARAFGWAMTLGCAVSVSHVIALLHIPSGH